MAPHMHFPWYVRTSFVFLILAAACSSSAHPPTVDNTTAGPVTEYRNALWYDGHVFVARTMYVRGDRFVAATAHVDRVVDLAGGYVVPPYGDAHNHWVEAPLVDAYIAENLRAGIFYVRDMGTPPVVHDAMRAKLNRPDSVDYVATHQGFTGPSGHPMELVDQLVGFGVLPAAWGATHGEGDAVFAVASDADVERAWPRLVATKPAFVKLFLVHSDQYAARRDDRKLTPKQRGLDPALVPAIVARARAAHLQVAAHIEDAHDFHVAIAAGVDDIAHLPFVDAAHPELYRLADADVRAAGARHVTVATTLEWLDGAAPPDPRLAVTRDNLARLRAAGAIIVIGTDLFRTTARAEVDRIAALGLMTSAELLHAWSIDTPRAIVPGREVGRLEPSAEASFLVLGGDPIADIAKLHAILRRVKSGVALAPGAATFPPLG
jgi:imidazolonepropionase-like amidohydrolase